jgi:predicted transposase/invertase (TIGR01784 family)
MKMRVATFEKDINIRRQFMASSKLADIREFIKPVYFEGLEKGKLEGKQEGKLEGKLETARLMKAKNLELSLILEFTGLSESKLKENGII